MILISYMTGFIWKNSLHVNPLLEIPLLDLFLSVKVVYERNAIVPSSLF